MFRRLDAAVHGAFQWGVDLTGASPVHAARLACVGYAVSTTCKVALAGGAVWLLPLVVMTMLPLVAMFVLGSAGFLASVISPIRFLRAPLLVFDVLLGAVRLLGDDPLLPVSVIASLCWYAMVYLLDCRPPPPPMPRGRLVPAP